MKKFLMVCFTIALTTLSYAADKVAEDLVTIITQQGTFKRPLYKSVEKEVNISDFDLSGDIASINDFQDVVDIQKQTNDVLPYPIIIYDTGKKSLTGDHCTGQKVITRWDNQQNTSYVVMCLPLQMYSGDKRDFFLRHELGHLRKEYHKSAYKITFNKTIRESLDYERSCHYGWLMRDTVYTLAAYLTSFVPNVLIGKAAIVGMYYLALRGAYNFGVSKERTYLPGKILHNVEFSCDLFAAESGKTSEEKIKLARAGITFLSSVNNSLFSRVLERIFTLDHPSGILRIERLTAFIAEQQKLLINPVIAEADLQNLRN